MSRRISPAVAVSAALAVAPASRARAEAAPAPGRAAVCDRFVGPAEVSARDGEIGAPRAPCASRDVGVRLRGAALIDVPDFYGTLGGSGTVVARVPAGALEAGAAARAADWRFVQNASVKASESSVGPLTLHALLPLLAARGRLALAPALRAQLPGTSSAEDVPAGAAEPALYAGLRPVPWLSLSGHASLIAWGALPPGGRHGRLAAAAGGGAGAAWRWLFLSAGGEAQAGWYGAGLDHVLVRAALGARGRLGHVSFAVLAPLAGAERTDLVAALHYSHEL